MDAVRGINTEERVMGSSINQQNLSFLSYSYSSGSGGITTKAQGNTVSAIARNIVRGMSDSFERKTQLIGLKNAFHKIQPPLHSSGSVIAGMGLIRELNPAPIAHSQPDLQNVNMNDRPNSSMSLDVSVDISVSAGGGSKGNAGGTGNSALDGQIAKNMQQAEKIKNQLRLDDRADWGLDSLAQDLAVFGLDFSGMSGDPAALQQTLQDKAQEMLDALASGAAKNKAAGAGDAAAGRNRITGALSRLTTGLAGAGMGAAADWSVSADVSTTVNVGGKDIDAGFVIDVGNVIVDPLALDLAGDGLDLKGADGGVEFDMDGDGTKTRMGFVRGDDALLFEDTHGDGMVHDGRQLFGNDNGHANGFEELRSHDDNKDGVIDRNDAIYDSLRVWVEKTEDGVTGEGETMSLEEAGIASINVGYENVREDDGTGNLIGQKGEFTRDDGSSGLAADVWFQERK